MEAAYSTKSLNINITPADSRPEKTVVMGGGRGGGLTGCGQSHDPGQADISEGVPLHRVRRLGESDGHHRADFTLSRGDRQTELRRDQNRHRGAEFDGKTTEISCLELLSIEKERKKGGRLTWEE